MHERIYELKVKCKCKVEPCPLRLCDGSGEIIEMSRDNLNVLKCPHLGPAGDEQLQEEQSKVL